MNILAGPNGSGKSTVLENRMPKDIIRLNADVFSREIVMRKYFAEEIKRGEVIPKDIIQAIVDNSNAYQMAGAKKLSEMIQESIKHYISFVAETTLSLKAYKKYINQAKGPLRPCVSRDGSI